MDYPDHTPYGICTCDACEKNQLRQRVAELERFHELDTKQIDYLFEERDALKQQRDELVAALEQFATWDRMQHKAQSKGCHATFDMMSLKDEIDLAEAAIASRIVACVNACAGIPTDDLEHGDIAKALKIFALDSATFRRQRDELLAALQSISKITGEAGFNIGGPLEHCQGELEHDEAKRLLSLACEYLKDTSKAAYRVIASVKEKQNAANR